MGAVKQVLIIAAGVVLGGIILSCLWLFVSFALLTGSMDAMNKMLGEPVAARPKAGHASTAEKSPVPKPVVKKNKPFLKKPEIYRLEAEFENSYQPTDSRCKYSNDEHVYFCINERMKAKEKFMSVNGFEKCNLLQSRRDCW